MSLLAVCPIQMPVSMLGGTAHAESLCKMHNRSTTSATGDEGRHR